jgi:hypothetical protein
MARAAKIRLAPLEGFGFWQKVFGGFNSRRDQFFGHRSRQNGRS